jgi:DNA-binding LacI/PurR family transcriptional regulator
MRAATIYDVARRAGVSHQTVSRYLSGYEGIRPETRARVESALADLDYRPNAAARHLRAQRINRIGVLADRVDQTGPARIIAGATRAAQQRGYLLDVVVTDGLDLDSIEAALAVVLEYQVAGILALAQTDLVIDRLQQHGGSVLLLDSRMAVAPGGPSMNAHSGHLAAEHLLELGHRRVGYVSGPLAWIAARERMAGFRSRIEEGGGELVWMREGDWTAPSGFAAWGTLTPAERRVTAVATGNDSTAIGLMSAAEADGIIVPADLSVIGNDDIDEARYLLPALSTITVDFEGEGRVLVERVIAGVENDETPPLPAARPRLAPRRSTRAIGTTR